MKSIYVILIILVAGLMTTACDKFLERSAQDLYIPTLTEDYADILRGESYFQELLLKYHLVALMTDDVEYLDFNKHVGFQFTSVALDSRIPSYIDAYRWKAEIEAPNTPDAAYQYLYKQAQIANIVLENLEGSKGTAEEKELLRGQASFIRAFSYLMLANIYAKPYALAQSGDPCIPIKLESTPSTDPYPRSTFKQVYSLILSDISTAIADLKDKDVPNIYEVNYPAALVLAMRTALYMEDWDNAIKYGEEFIGLGKYSLMDITGYTKATNSTTQGPDAAVTNFISRINPEIAWVFGSSTGMSERNYTTMLNFMNLAAGGFRVSGPKTVGGTNYAEDQSTREGTLIGIFDYDFTANVGDHRLPYWFMRPLWRSNTYCSRISNYLSFKYDYSTYEPANVRFAGNFAFRLGEVYITLAEAWARKPSPDAGKAVGYLNDLRVKRISPYTNLAVGDFAGNGALVEFIWEERRRELCMEELHRWWDLRRTTRPRIVHKVNDETWVLEENDPAYTLNFPLSERLYSGTVLGSNPRPERSAQ